MLTSTMFHSFHSYTLDWTHIIWLYTAAIWHVWRDTASKCRCCHKSSSCTDGAWMYLHIPLIHTSPQWLVIYSGLLHCRIAATAMLTINLPTAVEMHVCCKGNSKLILLWNSERMGKGNWTPTASEYFPRLLTPLSLSIPTSTLDSGSTEFKFKCNLNWDCHWLPSCWRQGQLELALKLLRLGEVISPLHPCSCSLEIHCTYHFSICHLPLWPHQCKGGLTTIHLGWHWPRLDPTNLTLDFHSQGGASCLCSEAHSSCIDDHLPLKLFYTTNIWVKDLCLPSKMAVGAEGGEGGDAVVEA